MLTDVTASESHLSSPQAINNSYSGAPTCDTETQAAIDSPADVAREPYQFLEYDSTPREFRVLPWLEDRLQRTKAGRDQLGLVHTLIELKQFSAANSIVACDEAQYLVKQCKNKGPDGKFHLMHTVSVFCHKPWCQRCGQAEERLDFYLYRTGDNVAFAAMDTIRTCEINHLPATVARFSFYIYTPSLTFAAMRANQENIQAKFELWRKQLASRFSIPPAALGFFIADQLVTNKSALRVVYVGPDIDFAEMRDIWKSVAGESARFTHSRMSVSSKTFLASEEHEKAFIGMIEAEMQQALDGWGWVRRSEPRKRAHLQVAFRGYKLIRRAGSFYGYHREDELEFQSDVAEADVDAVAELPIEELDLGVCCVCHEPLVLPMVKRFNSSREFNHLATHILSGNRKPRAPHKHLVVSMCGSRAASQPWGMRNIRAGP